MTVNPYSVIEQGFYVFPVKPKLKTPLVRWAEEASNDPAKIAEWESKFTGCDWGFPTGSLNQVSVIDVDTDEADAWWAEKWLPEGKSIQTPRGGRHILYDTTDSDVDVQTNVSKVFPGIDIRGEGGYIVLYSDDLKDIPALPASVAELLPERQEYVTEIPQDIEPAAELSESEKRVLKGITDTLDALPRVWVPGAMYHAASFQAACWLQRISNSPYYATTRDEAHALYNAHVPLREGEGTALRDQRWNSALKITEGQMAEHPGDTPIRLKVDDELLSRFADSEVDRLFWESKSIGDVKKLIRALRMKGASEQESYSISYESSAMKNIRKSNSGSSSTWGYVTKEYSTSIPATDEKVADGWGEPAEEEASSGVPVRLLSEAERDIVRDYPNFIDQYTLAAKVLYAEPNLPLHYVNSWIALSVGIGDRGAIYEEKGRSPLSLWAFNLAPTAAGKSDANDMMRNSIDGVRHGGWGSVNLGSDSSSEQLVEVVMDRGNQSSGLFIDECRKFLMGVKSKGESYQSRTMETCLALYDGRAERALRKGMDKEKVGETSDVSFTLWLQGAWKRVVEILDESDIESGFVGRFLVAVGGGANVTRESLTPRIASEFQVENGGRHPIMDSFCGPIKNSVASLPDSKNRIDFASQEVLERYVDMREALDKFADTHPLSEHLKGVLLRVGFNMLKGAALIALSESRTLIEMEDLLLAMKSGEYWVKGSVELAEAVSASQYRRLVDHLVKFVELHPRTNAAILGSQKFQNLKRFEVEEIVERAERENRIRLVNGKWEVVE